MGMIYSVEMACTSHKGKIRSENQDNYVFQGEFLPEHHLSMNEIIYSEKLTDDIFAVALFDGMGGECRGELASYEAAKAFSKETFENTWDVQKMRNIMLRLNDEVCRAQNEKRICRMGTTAVILLFDNQRAWISNVGDSPAYMERDGDLNLLTVAHTDAEMLKKQEIENRKPTLTQYLGIPQEEFLLEPYIDMIEIKQGDQFLLCSDGLTDMISEEEIRGVFLEQIEIVKKVEKLVKKALMRGGRDNITVILCQIKHHSEGEEKNEY